MSLYLNIFLIFFSVQCTDADPSKCGDNMKCLSTICVCDPSTYVDASDTDHTEGCGESELKTTSEGIYYNQINVLIVRSSV